MSGINTGILHNAEPLSVDAIKALEKKILEDNKTYAYLDQAGKLCFAMQRGVDGIKDLAWNNAYELTNAGSILTKRAYKKTGLKTFVLDSTYTKPSLNASWTVGEIPIFEFDGSIEGRLYVYSDRHDAMLVKVSDSVLTSQMLLGSTLTYITGEFGADVENTVLLDNTESVCSIIGDTGTEEGCLVETIDGSHIVSVSNSWLLPDFFNWDIELEPGTYFIVYSNEAAEERGFSKFYTKSISCLTIADATNPTTTTAERLEGDGQEFYTTAPSTLAFRSTAPLSEFQDVQINGETIDPSNYTLEDGSTIVKLSHEYLKTLAVGSYELSVVSNSKTVKGDFTVASPELNEYGFYYNQPYSFIVEDEGAIILRFGPKLVITDLNHAISACDMLMLEFATGKISKETFPYIVKGTDIYINAGGDPIDFDSYVVFVSITPEGFIGASGTELEGVPFTLGSSVCVMDDTYCYLYSKVLGGYTVASNINTLEEYPKAIKNNIYNYPVLNISENAFSNCQAAKVVLPNSLTTISSRAFHSSVIDEIIIPDGVVSIGDYAFKDSKSLRKLTLGAGLTNIGESAFENCWLPDVEFHPNSSLQHIGKNAFHCCSLSEHLTLPDGLVSIGSGAFYNSDISSVSLPSSLTSITAGELGRSGAFGQCANLASVTFRGTCAQCLSVGLNKRTIFDNNNPFETLVEFIQCSDGRVPLEN